MIDGEWQASVESVWRPAGRGGAYGRMFPGLPAFEPPGRSLAERERQLRKLADKMIGQKSEAASMQNFGVPAGYTYLGQFIGHDLSFDLRTVSDRDGDPYEISNQRTPRFDLDSVYGPGPAAIPHLYVADGEAATADRVLFRIATEKRRKDVPRLGNDAVVADPRNMSHYITSQIHLAVMLFHNHAVAELRIKEGLEGARAFAKARRLTRWHYQWVVVMDFLKRLTKWHDHVEPQLRGQRVDSLFRWQQMPFMPIEFAISAFRFGHSMVRSEYRLDLETTVPLADLLPGNRKKLPEIDWSYLLGARGARRVDTHYSRKLSPSLTASLARLPPEMRGGGDGLDSLTARDLFRSWTMRLPSGQCVARAIGVRAGASQEEPLSYYLLREANQEGWGARLGPVGSRIVADVMLGLLWSDAESFLRGEAHWQPSFGKVAADYHFADFLAYAGMKMSGSTPQRSSRTEGRGKKGRGGATSPPDDGEREAES